MMAPQDKLAVITCTEPGVDPKALAEKIKTLCGKTKYTTAALEREVNHTIFQRIKQYLKDEMNDNNYIDFVAVGSKGVGSSQKDSPEYVGSVATLVLTARNMNCIFVP